tara:strand:+ start:116 stop:517 length:402 start_codon:yes stop_codon:yes gene_type:complete
MSSWTTEHLRDLKEVTNHKVIYDSYEFVWMSKIDNKWSRHYIDNFKDYKTPMSWIHFNLTVWNNEYIKRQSKYLRDMKEELEVDIKITEISRESSVRTKEKIREIIELKPNISNKQISEILGVTIRTIERHKK